MLYAYLNNEIILAFKLLILYVLCTLIIFLILNKNILIFSYYLCSSMWLSYQKCEESDPDSYYKAEELIVNILFWANNLWNFCSDSVICGVLRPVAAETFVSCWACTHALKSACEFSPKNFVCDRSSPINVDSLDTFWQIESSRSINELDSKSESFATKIINSIHHTGERYETPLPWKTDCPNLHDNYTIAVKRLQSLINKVNPTVLCNYDQHIRSLESENITQWKKERNYVHPVFKKGKKLRIVLNCSFTTKGGSLNDCLETGPTCSANWHLKIVYLMWMLLWDACIAYALLGQILWLIVEMLR